ncbi:hypothetical protein MSHO_01900 [Mycobacterium shottsii]|uniref:Uncharacterized protein n=1 Tax=Mycobacterium shottsii TaxID=133549 RepID=A0A7I7L533_9MYCO|nr:hypothetical protein MSHO_01900 [Mycobacterium shottsii]
MSAPSTARPANTTGETNLIGRAGFTRSARTAGAPRPASPTEQRVAHAARTTSSAVTPGRVKAHARTPVAAGTTGAGR